MKNILTLIFLFFFSLYLYIFTIRGVLGNINPKLIQNNLDQAAKPFELSPERGRFILTLSLAENKSFALKQELADAAFPDVGYYKGKFYIYFAPGISLLALPFYLIGKSFNLSQVSSFFTVSLFAGLTLILLFQIAKNIFKLPIWISLLVPLIFGFASTSWSYAITLYQHHVTTFFIISSFYAVWKYKQKTKYSWIFGLYVWFAYGYAILIDYPNAILMIPIIFYFFISSWRLTKEKLSIKLSFRWAFIVTSAIFFLINILHGYYNFVNFGSPFKISGTLVGYKKIREQQILSNKNKENVLESLAQKKTLGRFFKEERLPSGFSIMLFARDKGLFIFSTIYVLGILGLILRLKKVTLQTFILASIFTINLFLYSSFGDPWGGWAFGPRYLIPSMAILAIFVGVWLNNAKHKIISRIVAFLLFGYSSFIALLGALTTNQVPPKVEADFLKMKYNFFLNWDYFMSGRSGSFVFNEYASKNMNLQQYFLLIYIPLILIVFTLLFIVPLFEVKSISSSKLQSKK